MRSIQTGRGYPRISLKGNNGTVRTISNYRAESVESSDYICINVVPFFVAILFNEGNGRAGFPVELAPGHL
jgi:hypothetical protein